MWWPVVTQKYAATIERTAVDALTRQRFVDIAAADWLSLFHLQLIIVGVKVL